MSRREMLTLCRNGFGSVALMGLMGGLSYGCKPAKENRILNSLGFKEKLPHYLPKAKSIIFLYMDGGISQVDSFDPKPRLDKENGQNPYDKFKVDATQFDNIGKLLK
ncbi:MAG: DUF1501 domain-containing protein, partial [Aurantibacter sp.]